MGNRFILAASLLSLAAAGCCARHEKTSADPPPASPGAQQKPATKGPAAPVTAPPATEAPRAGAQPPTSPTDPNALAPDGLPVVIPPPGSKPPTVAEWETVTKEVTVKGSSALRCKTRMLREWLNVQCEKNHLGIPIMPEPHPAAGVQVYKSLNSQRASVVIQVVKGKTSDVGFIWDKNGGHDGKVLNVVWAASSPRPMMYFE